jgi:3-hydroxyanthranilate 3,4-dioxygenase
MVDDCRHGFPVRVLQVFYTANMSFPILNLQKWIKANRKHLVPPVSNKQLFTGESHDVILFVSGGPNTRNDYHVNPTEELFYQLKGDIAVRLRPLDGSKPYDQIIREGELFLLPRWVPHRPQRPAGTVGLIVEFPRPKGQLDALRWYCPACDTLVHEAAWRLKKIDEDLKIVMEDFWGGDPARRTCPSCSHIIQRAGAISLTAGKVRAAKKATKKPLAKEPLAKKKTDARGKSRTRAAARA